MANGTIAFDTLQTSGQIDGTARSIDTDFLLNGCAKSYTFANSDAGLTGDSFNISSSSDDGTGDYSFVFTNNLSTNNEEELNIILKKIDDELYFKNLDIIKVEKYIDFVNDLFIESEIIF